MQLRISNDLLRLASLFSIKDFDGKKSAILSEWIIDNYKYDTLDCVLSVLKSPPPTEEKVWRLTPDVIREWMAIELDKRAEARERKWSQIKNKEAEKDEKYVPVTDERLKEIFKDSWIAQQFNEDEYQKKKAEYLNERKNDQAGDGRGEPERSGLAGESIEEIERASEDLYTERTAEEKPAAT